MCQKMCQDHGFVHVAKFRPDFVLTDGDRDWALEVFGITQDLVYKARKERKLAFYRQQLISC
jgi:hypothetical protein